MHFTALILAFINNLVRSDYYSLDIFKYVLFVKILSHFNVLYSIELIDISHAHLLFIVFFFKILPKKTEFPSITSRARINK